jgi:hypothetical protein
VCITRYAARYPFTIEKLHEIASATLELPTIHPELEARIAEFEMSPSLHGLDCCDERALCAIISVENANANTKRQTA